MGKREIKEEIKKMYIEEKMEVEEICTILEIVRQTFYYHKKQDKKNNVDWDELRLANIQNKEEAKVTYKEFVAKLIILFEKKLKETELTLDEIAKYASILNKLKDPVKDCKQERITTAKETVKFIADITIKENREDLAELLSKHAEEIISKISKIA